MGQRTARIERQLPAITLMIMLIAAQAGLVLLPELGIVWLITDGVLAAGVIALALLYSGEN